MTDKYQRWLLTTRGYLTVGGIAVVIIIYGWGHLSGG
jgi:hypothetical protein